MKEIMYQIIWEIGCDYIIDSFEKLVDKLTNMTCCKIQKNKITSKN